MASRPPVHIDLDQLERFMQFKPTKAVTASFFKCSEDTIERRIREMTKSEELPEGLSFMEFRDQALAQVKLKIFNEVMNSLDKPAVLIFACKNLLDWTDKQQIDAAVVGRSLESKSDEEVQARFRELLLKASEAK